MCTAQATQQARLIPCNLLQLTCVSLCSLPLWLVHVPALAFHAALTFASSNSFSMSLMSVSARRANSCGVRLLKNQSNLQAARQQHGCLVSG
jgi:hypothetical protein